MPAAKRAKPAPSKLDKPARLAQKKRTAQKRGARKRTADIGSRVGRVDRRLRALEHQARAAAVALALAGARITGHRELGALVALGLADLVALKRFLAERPAPRRAPLDPTLKAFVRESARPVGGAK